MHGSNHKKINMWNRLLSIFRNQKSVEYDLNSDQDNFDDLLRKQRAIIHHIHAMIREVNPDTAIQNILNELLDFLKVDHVSIIEYDLENSVTNCTYEAMKEGVIGIKDSCHALPVNQFTWWTEQIKKDIPIVIHRIDQMSPKAALAKQKMEEQGVKSIMVVPFISKNEGLGYICADTIHQYRKWNNNDYQWFFSFSNVISIYIELRRREARRLKANTEISKFEQLFKLIADHAKVGYAQYNALTKEGYAADSWYQNVGAAPGTPLPEVLNEKKYIHPDDREMLESLSKQLTTGEANSLRANVRVIHKDGRLTWSCFNCVVRDFRPDENVIEVLSINYDITELKDMESKLIEARNKAETSDRLKSAFLANMSHEIRTPLNSIIGFSDLLIHCDDEEERREYAEIVRKNNAILLQLISDILNISKIESGTFEFHIKEIDVKQLCTETIYAYQMEAKDQVKIQLEEGLKEYTIQGDKARINQIICNFLNNAIKFTEQGSITLGYQQLSEHELKFYVRDTGIGIAADKLNIVFDRFVKLNSFTSGTGLGLPICKSIVEQIGGKIGVDSKEGEGSCFWFTHPM